MVSALNKPKQANTLERSKSKGAGTVGRQRTREPDPNTPEGQCALYLRHLMTERDKDAKSLADEIGVGRTTVFNYLAGETTPSDTTRNAIAKSLGLRDYRDLMPTDAFLAGIKRRRAR